MKTDYSIECETCGNYNISPVKCESCWRKEINRKNMKITPRKLSNLLKSAFILGKNNYPDKSANLWIKIRIEEVKDNDKK